MNNSSILAWAPVEGGFISSCSVGAPTHSDWCCVKRKRTTVSPNILRNIFSKLCHLGTVNTLDEKIGSLYSSLWRSLLLWKLSNIYKHAVATNNPVFDHSGRLTQIKQTLKHSDRNASQHLHQALKPILNESSVKCAYEMMFCGKCCIMFEAVSKSDEINFQL